MSSTTQDILVRMGFPIHRAEKAVVSTGDINVQCALEWILSHKDDPFLDSAENREYIFYLCPTGALATNIQDFRAKSADLCGKNGAFRHMPHVTILPAFRADAGSVSMITRAIDNARRIMTENESHPQKVRVDFHASEKEPFIGLFLDEKSDKAAKEFSRILLNEVHSLIAPDGETPGISGKRLHLTLAHGYSSEQRQAIMKLAQGIHVKNRAGWYFLLLSRDPRFNGHEVYRMYYPWESSLVRGDEISFTPDDYVYISPNELERSQSGWVRGTSWGSGKTGLIPLNGLTRCVDSDVWILHHAIPFVNEDAPKSESNEQLYPAAQRKRWVQAEKRSNRRLHPAVRSSTGTKDGFPKPIQKHSHESNASASSSSCTLYVMRHGERMDFVFGLEWINTCFDASTGSFTRSDLNMPKSLPKRQDGPLAYVSDPPLTAMGLLQAQITGKAMKDAGVSFDRVFVSPALRSVQTATAVVEACCDRKMVKLCVEPGLYEWLGWVRQEHPAFLHPSELHSFGIPVDQEYSPIFPMDQLDYDEDVKNYYKRNGHVAKCIVDKYDQHGGNILLVGHASTLDTCTRQLIGCEPRTHIEMNKVTQKVPYCAVITCCQNADKNGWVLRNPPFPALTHGANIRFNAIQTISTPDAAIPVRSVPNASSSDGIPSVPKTRRSSSKDISV